MYVRHATIFAAQKIRKIWMKYIAFTNSFTYTSGIYFWEASDSKGGYSQYTWVKLSMLKTRVQRINICNFNL